MAPKRGGKAARNLVNSLGLRGSLDAFIKRAIIQGWDPDEIAINLVRTKAFKRTFPGLVQNGALRPEFSGGLQFGEAALTAAVKNYNTGYEQLEAMADRVGFSGKINRRVFGLMVRQGKSLDEFGANLQLIKNIRSNPELIDLYNEQRKFAGLKPLGGRAEFLKAAARQDPEFIDSYQAAFLRQQGLDLTAEQAAAASKADSPLQQNMNLAELVAQVRETYADIGPELARAGIDQGYLTLLGQGSDPQGKAGQLQQILNQRRSLQQTPRGAQARQSSTGGFAIFEEDEAASY